MDEGKKEWWTYPRWSDEYENGLDRYVEKTFSSDSQGGEMRCPCKKCCYRYWFQPRIVKDHVISKGFIPMPEMDSTPCVNDREVEMDEANCEGEACNNDDMAGLLHDVSRQGLNAETKRFYELVDEGQQELYPGCKNFSRLSFIIRLFVYKCDHRLNNAAFADLLEILRAMQPEAKLPSSFNEANSVLKALGLDYTKIDACPNDCMLFWEENAEASSCNVCHASRWKSSESDDDNKKKHRIPAKVLRYFPIKRRLQRLYMCSETARLMTWHADSRPNDGLLRHPADGEAWKKFDLSFPRFAQDPRNIRLALTTDGFNPFSSMSIAHSTWPVLLINYNLPPWMCMKPEFIMLALLIPGPLSPGNNIDIYLQPLIKDLKELWNVGVETHDCTTNQMFDLHAALMTTISDFPAYAMLSGWSTKGKMACPNCHYETCSQWLKRSEKMCYMGHRRFLDMSHPYRRCRRKFNGKNELRAPPIRLSGAEVCHLLSGYQNGFGKINKRKRPNVKDKEGGDNPWRKRSIFFELPYWKFNVLRHSLDVMHIEKNVCDSILGTLLNIPGKTKDHMKARQDLVDLNMMPELQPKESSDGQRAEYAKARFWMTKEEKRMFCRTIKNAKLPQGYGSNIARCVHVGELKIVNYKSHDAHFLLQYLLPIAIRTTLHKDVATPLMRLSAFFKGICDKVVIPSDLVHLQDEISQILCQFETIFPPAFFDIMIHLPIHLVDEIKLGGPVALRWMYPIERYLRKLKSYVRNKGRPEGSMAEGYIAQECAIFCSRYLHGKIGSRHDVPETVLSGSNDEIERPAIFLKIGRPISGKGRKSKKEDHGGFKIDPMALDQAHRYVLFNSDDNDIDKYIRDHEHLMSNCRKRKWDRAQSHGRGFADWFKEKVESELISGSQVPDHVKWLSHGPSPVVKRYTGYFVNGFMFHTVKRDAKCVTNNTGVMLIAKTQSFASRRDYNPVVGDVTYYGSIEDIIEIFYHGNSSIVLFMCSWFSTAKDSYGFTRVNCNHTICTEEPFILASQASQVFFIDDPSCSGWRYVVRNLPKDDGYCEAKGYDDGAYDSSWKDFTCPSQGLDARVDDDDEISRVRDDLPAIVIHRSNSTRDGEDTLNEFIED